jgi:hypothetical protein
MYIGSAGETSDPRGRNMDGESVQSPKGTLDRIEMTTS